MSDCVLQEFKFIRFTFELFPLDCGNASYLRKLGDSA